MIKKKKQTQYLKNYIILSLFKITLSHVIVYYPSRSFYARGAIAIKGTLAQYNRL